MWMVISTNIKPHINSKFYSSDYNFQMPSHDYKIIAPEKADGSSKSKQRPSIQLSPTLQKPVFIITKNMSQNHINVLVETLEKHRINFQMQQETSTLGFNLNQRFFVLVDNKYGEVCLGPEFGSILMTIVGYPKLGKNPKNTYCQTVNDVLEAYFSFKYPAEITKAAKSLIKDGANLSQSSLTEYKNQKNTIQLKYVISIDNGEGKKGENKNQSKIRKSIQKGQESKKEGLKSNILPKQDTIIQMQSNPKRLIALQDSDDSVYSQYLDQIVPLESGDLQIIKVKDFKAAEPFLSQLSKDNYLLVNLKNAGKAIEGIGKQKVIVANFAKEDNSKYASILNLKNNKVFALACTPKEMSKILQAKGLLVSNTESVFQNTGQLKKPLSMIKQDRREEENSVRIAEQKNKMVKIDEKKVSINNQLKPRQVKKKKSSIEDVVLINELENQAKLGKIIQPKIEIKSNQNKQFKEQKSIITIPNPKVKQVYQSNLKQSKQSPSKQLKGNLKLRNSAEVNIIKPKIRQVSITETQKCLNKVQIIQPKGQPAKLPQQNITIDPKFVKKNQNQLTKIQDNKQLQTPSKQPQTQVESSNASEISISQKSPGGSRRIKRIGKSKDRKNNLDNSKVSSQFNESGKSHINGPNPDYYTEKSKTPNQGERSSLVQSILVKTVERTLKNDEANKQNGKSKEKKSLKFKESVLLQAGLPALNKKRVKSVQKVQPETIEILVQDATTMPLQQYGLNYNSNTYSGANFGNTLKSAYNSKLSESNSSGWATKTPRSRSYTTDGPFHQLSLMKSSLLKPKPQQPVIDGLLYKDFNPYLKQISQQMQKANPSIHPHSFYYIDQFDRAVRKMKNNIIMTGASHKEFNFIALIQKADIPQFLQYLYTKNQSYEEAEKLGFNKETCYEGFSLTLKSKCEAKYIYRLFYLNSQAEDEESCQFGKIQVIANPLVTTPNKTSLSHRDDIINTLSKEGKSLQQSGVKLINSRKSEQISSSCPYASQALRHSLRA